MEDRTEERRQELIDMLQGRDAITRPILGVHFMETDEVLYLSPPTLSQLKLPAILFAYDSRQQWEESDRHADEMLYNRQGKLILKGKGYGKTEE